MRKLIAIGLVMLALSGSAFAGDVQEPRTDALLVAPLAAGLAAAFQAPFLLVEYQHSFFPDLGLILNTGALFLTNVNALIGIVEVGPRFALTGGNLEGLYVFPLAGLIFNPAGDSRFVAAFEAGLEAGYTWIWSSGFMLSTSAGLSIALGPDGEVVDMLIPRVGLNLGYSW
jgi:hypothetical protein